MTKQTTLSRRGLELANGENIREKFNAILGNPYDPDTNPDGFINLGVAENYAMLPEITEYVKENVVFSTSTFSYGEGPWGTDRLRKAMAKFINKNFNVLNPIDPEDLMFANGVTSLCEMLGHTIADPGDAILMSKPIYQAFQMDFGLKAKVKSVFASFNGVDQFSPEAVVKYEDALLEAERSGCKIRGLMLCNPHNPLGQCYPKETIIALMKLCSKYKVHLLCDEIYATSVYDVPDSHAVKFTSALSFDHSPYISSDLVHVIYGLSKDFAAGGTRLGCVHIQNKELMRAMSSITQFHWSGGPSQDIATTMLEDEQWLPAYLARARDRLSSRNKLTRKILDSAGIKYHQGANAGFFLWIDLRPYLPTRGSHFSSEWDREKALIKTMFDHGVFVTDGQGLSAEEPGFFRVIFSQDEKVLEVGLKRLLKAIGK